MKKIVNGQAVNIPNIELFERAAEARACNVQCCSAITDIIAENQEKINLYNLYIISYLRIYKSLPYPLNSIEDPIKYAVIGTFMLDKSTSPIQMWADDGLNIVLDLETRKVLKLKGIYWAIQTASEIKEDNTSIDNFEESVGYREYEWVLKQLMSGKNTTQFYEVFMPQFVQACRNQPMILKWELGNILKFGSIPRQTVLKKNFILDKAKNKQYTLDTYVSGIRKDTSNITITVSNMPDGQDGERYETIKVYGFTVFEKPILFTNDMKSGDDRLKKKDIPCITQLFQRLCAIKAANEDTEFEDYTGAIVGDHFVYEVCHRLYIGDKDIAFGDKEIARGIEIYALDKRMVYFCKDTRTENDIMKRTLYSYCFEDESIRVVSIEYIKS